MVTFNLSRSASYFESGIGRGMGFRDSNQDLLGFVHQIPAGFLDIGNHGQDQPERIVVEISSDLVVALLGQRLILVIRAAVRQLRGGEIK